MLTGIILLPLAGAALAVGFGRDARLARWVALGAAVAELALALAVVALGLGSLLAWLVITQLFEFDWLPDWSEIFAVLGMGLAVVMAFAIGGSLPLLRAKPAQALRAL